jgi:hypothetical protein
MTSDTQDLRDADYLKRRLIEICEAHPERRNPLQGSACLYQTATDPEDNCLIGWLAREEGWTVPSEDSNDRAGTVAHLLDWPVTDNGAEFLSSAQVRADGFVGEGKPTRWGDLINDLKGLAT